MAYRNYSTAVSHIVDSTGQGDFITIGAALTAAVSGQTIFIRPGTYTENPALKAGVNLVAYDADALTANVIINGKCTFSSAGTVSLSGIELQTNSDFFLAITGSAASIVTLTDCYLNCLNNTGISFTTANTSATLDIYGCKGNLATTGIGFYTTSSTGNVRISACLFDNSGLSTTESSNSSGNVTYYNSNFGHPVSTTGSGVVNLFNCTITPLTNFTCVAIAGTGSTTISNCYLNSGSSSAISIGSGTQGVVTNSTIFSNNTNAITGGGTILDGGLVFYGSSSTINTTTRIPLAFSVPEGGTGNTSATAFALQAGGTTSTASHQSLTTGSSGQILKSNGSAALPSWINNTSGNLVLIQTQTASSSSNLDFTTGITSTYNNYFMIGSNISTSAAAALLIRISTNGGSTYIATNYLSGENSNAYNSTTLANNSNTTGLYLCHVLANTNFVGANVFLYNLTSGVNYINATGNRSHFNTSGSGAGFAYHGSTNSVANQVVNALRVIPSTGTFSGTISLYGILA